MRILLGNGYDYPQYYDLAFRADTRVEVPFIEEACQRYCLLPRTLRNTYPK